MTHSQQGVFNFAQHLKQKGKVINVPQLNKREQILDQFNQ